MVFLLTSEINAVLTIRDLDENDMSGEPITADLEDREVMWGKGMSASYRPWLSFGGLGLMIVGALTVFIPMCSVLADFGKSLDMFSFLLGRMHS